MYNYLNVNNRFNALINNVVGKSEFGGLQKIGANNIYDILQKTDELSTEYVQNYSEQKGIGCKPTLTYSGCELKKYSLPIKLHASFCNPDEIISKLEEKAAIREVFAYYRKNSYVGQFIITKVASKIINCIDDITIYAEITVDIQEYYDDTEDEYHQQTKSNNTKNLNLLETVSNKVNKAVDFLPEPAQNIFQRLTGAALKTAVRECESYVNSNVWGQL